MQLQSTYKHFLNNIRIDFKKFKYLQSKLLIILFLQEGKFSQRMYVLCTNIYIFPIHHHRHYPDTLMTLHYSKSTFFCFSVNHIPQSLCDLRNQYHSNTHYYQAFFISVLWTGSVLVLQLIITILLRKLFKKDKYLPLSPLCKISLSQTPPV